MEWLSLSSLNLNSTGAIDFYYVLGIAALFGVGKYCIEFLMLKEVAQALFIDNVKPSQPNYKTNNNELDDNTTKDLIVAQKQAAKFQATGFRFILNVIISSVGLWSAYHSPWFFNSKLWFTVDPPFEMSVYNRAHYLIDAGAYLYQLLSIKFEARQSDHNMMVIHHIVTLALIGISYWVGHTRVGEVVMLLHDICDPPLELAKLCLYLKYDTARDFFFHLFAGLFIVCRDILFPFLVLRGIIFDGYLLFGDRIPYAYECLFFLSILQILNIIWTYMIYRSATQPKLTDIRED